MALPVLSDLEFNAEDVAEAVAQHIQDENTSLSTIISNLANDYATLQSDIETNLKADSTFIANIADEVQGGSGMKFVQIGRPASGTPPSGSVWITYGLTTGHESMLGSAGRMAGWGFGFPVAIRESDGTETFLDGSNDSGGFALQGQLSASSPEATDDAAAALSEYAYNDHRYTYTVQMEIVS